MPEKKISDIFIENLEKYLSLNNMKYSDLAKLLNVSFSTISMWKSKKSLPRMETLDKLADLFNISASALLTDSNDNTNNLCFDAFTIAAHFEGEEYTEEELDEIKQFAEFIKSKRTMLPTIEADRQEFVKKGAIVKLEEQNP